MTIGGVEDMGISISVTHNSIHPEGSSDISIRPCFTGPFELPENYEPASPSYLICHDMKDFQKDVTIRMHHYASLQGEEDCEDMAFLTASSTPEYRKSEYREPSPVPDDREPSPVPDDREPSPDFEVE